VPAEVPPESHPHIDLSIKHINYDSFFAFNFIKYEQNKSFTKISNTAANHIKGGGGVGSGWGEG
jgi:hypothetical protein